MCKFIYLLLFVLSNLGDSSCKCTLNEPCGVKRKVNIICDHLNYFYRNIYLYLVVVNLGACAVQCRRVQTGQCPGDTSCLNDVGDCAGLTVIRISKLDREKAKGIVSSQTGIHVPILTNSPCEL